MNKKKISERYSKQLINNKFYGNITIKTEQDKKFEETKANDDLNTGYIYAPYIAIMETPIIIKVEEADNNKKLEDFYDENANGRDIEE